MSEVIVIDVSGRPVPKGRPRFASRGSGRPIAYTPAKTRSYETDVRYAAQQVMNGRALLTGALVMRVTASLQVPMSWSGKKRREALAGIHAPTKRPDIDNFAKTAMDALNCVVFADDSQITKLDVEKVYSDRPGLRIEIARIASSYRPGVIHVYERDGVAV